ncbi:aminoacyl tRNA synthase complex-interacting multifunctional protein 1 [Dermacentor andersoni]|uniref:aminoacyl tRNA synthase complex-interacting multifunctional protein 1 n=1 Tax=Dermacentor andersoni TaxID=34620 RepID=UPI0021559CCF|nr:aminoacyl tRNA synthase complex-interacting multifunctional protein 1-like [Dermacentor andersoni]
MIVDNALARVMSRAKQADELLALLTAQLESLRAARRERYVEAECARLRSENEQLRQEVEAWKNRLEAAEAGNGIAPVGASAQLAKPEQPAQTNNARPAARAVSQKPGDAGAGDQPKKRAGPAVDAKAPPAKKADAKKKLEDNDDSKPVDVSRLDLRVGRIVSAVKHPDADSLYVEQVDVGEGKPRTVVSGLVKFVPLDKMQNRMAVLLCNLKPAKMRGVTSEAMVMCASTPEKVEILAPPPGAQPGDRVVCDGYPGQPDAQLNPKKKIFEQVAPDLKTDGEKRATYKGQQWLVTGCQGHVTAETLCNVQIK